jgi:hypothetical protein
MFSLVHPRAKYYPQGFKQSVVRLVEQWHLDREQDLAGTSAAGKAATVHPNI